MARKKKKERKGMGQMGGGRSGGPMGQFGGSKKKRGKKRMAGR